MSGCVRHIGHKLLSGETEPDRAADTECAILRFPVQTFRLEPAIMSQPSLPRIGFIGAGRLARCLAVSFSRAGSPVTAVASRSAASAGRLASQMEHCAAFDHPQ